MEHKASERDDRPFADILAWLGPLPDSVRPSEEFIARTRRLLEQQEVVSLALFGLLKAGGRKRRSAA